MPFTGQVALPSDDVLAQCGCLPEPGTHFVMAGQEYECVGRNDTAGLVHAVPVG